MIPETEFSGRYLAFDFPSFRVGCARYVEGPTGCTVFHFPKRANYAVDIRGGSPGTLLLSNPESGDSFLDALCFTGGSVYGFEAMSGVYREIHSERNFSVGWQELARVIGAVIYDYRPRTNSIHPDLELGRAAYRAAIPGRFPLGRFGAGSSATVGKALGESAWELAGQGGAFRETNGVKIAVFSVVNAVGAIIDRSGRVVRGNKIDENRIHSHEHVSKGEVPSGNTTLTTVITNYKLNGFMLRQLARQVHSSMARAIQPFHTWKDGDVLVAISTQEVESTAFHDTHLAVMASELAWDAVLSSFDDDTQSR